MGLKIDPFATLDSFQRTADWIGLTTEHFELCALLKIIGGLGRTAKAVQDEAAIVKGPRIPTAAFNSRIERVERFRLVPGKERVDAAAIQLFEHGVLAVTSGGYKDQEGSCCPKCFTGHGTVLHYQGNVNLGRESPLRPKAHLS